MIPNTNTEPLYRLTIGEFNELIRETITEILEQKKQSESEKKPQKRFVYGLNGIAEIFNCSRRKASSIKASGIIDGAISQIGHTMAIEVDKAIELSRLSRFENDVKKIYKQNGQKHNH